MAIFFVAIEGALWLGGVTPLLSERDPFQGFSGAVRVFELDESRGRYVTPARAIRHSFNAQEFAAGKPANGFRAFVLGGSSAYGFPWGAEIAFSRLLEAALRESYPEREIEIVNAAAMSYGSHRLRILAEELLRYEPDVLVVYGGHNEFVERRFYRDQLARSANLDALKKLLHRWRLYSVLRRALERATTDEPLAEPGERDTGELLGIDVAREYSVEVGELEVLEARRDLEANLDAIVFSARGAGVPVVLCTVPSNLRGWRPNQAFFDDEVPPAERERVLEAIDRARAAIDRGAAASAVTILEPLVPLAPRYADLHYELGRAYERVERWGDALAAYVRARDTDGQPSRAVSALNDAIRRQAGRPGVILVDIEAHLRTLSEHGLLGFDYFEDYVHPKPEGHRRIAIELWRVFLEQGLLGPARTPQEEDLQAIYRVIGRPGAADPDAPAAAAGVGSLKALFNLGLVLENQGRVEEAMAKYQECVAIQPGYYIARLNLGRLLHRSGRYREAAAQYAAALEVARDGVHHARTLVGLGEALAALGRGAEALGYFRRAVEVDAGSAAAWRSLGAALAGDDRHIEAEAAFRRALELAPDDDESRANLGFALLFQNRLDEAETTFRRGVETNPEHVRTRNGLAAVLTEQGAYDEAIRIFEENLRRDPGNSFARSGVAIARERRDGVGGG